MNVKTVTHIKMQNYTVSGGKYLEMLSIFSHCAKRPKGNTHKLLLTRKWRHQYCTPKLDGFVVRPCSFPENKTHRTKMNDKWNKSALQKVGDNSRPTGNTSNFFFTGGKFTVIVVKTWLNGAFQWPRKAELKVRHDITTELTRFHL